MTDALDDIEKARRDLEAVTGSTDLADGQAVCPACNLVYWLPLGHCSNCAAYDN